MKHNGISVSFVGFLKVSKTTQTMKIIVSANSENENSTVMISNGKRLAVRVSW